MKKIFTLTFLALLVYAALTVYPAQAHHYIYLAEDPTKQIPDTGSPLTDNYVLVWCGGG